MTLHIDRLVLDEFRGYTHFELDGIARLTILAGENAVGKTNVVEGIQLLTMGESFRRPSWSETISWGSDAARLYARFCDEKHCVEHVLKIAGNERAYEVNGKKKTAAGVRGTFPCVLFIPDDLQMVKAASAKRRDALDLLGAQLSKNYASLKNDYQQTLRQRNLLIRDELAFGPLFESWNESLALNGARLLANRWRLFERLAAHMAQIYAAVVPGERLDAVYLPSWSRFDANGRQLGDASTLKEAPEAMLGAVDEMQREILDFAHTFGDVELRRKTSLVGPHKDEVAFFINGRNARLFASQGQQRTIVLCWKLAEVEVVRDVLGVEPLLLLDDVMSELDERHRFALTEFIDRSVQTFVTTTNLGYFSDELLERANIVRVPLEGTKHSY